MLDIVFRVGGESFYCISKFSPQVKAEIKYKKEWILLERILFLMLTDFYLNKA